MVAHRASKRAAAQCAGALPPSKEEEGGERANCIPPGRSSSAGQPCVMQFDRPAVRQPPGPAVPEMIPRYPRDPAQEQPQEPPRGQRRGTYAHGAAAWAGASRPADAGIEAAEHLPPWLLGGPGRRRDRQPSCTWSEPPLHLRSSTTAPLAHSMPLVARLLLATNSESCSHLFLSHLARVSTVSCLAIGGGASRGVSHASDAATCGHAAWPGSNVRCGARQGPGRGRAASPWLTQGPEHCSR